MKMRRLISPRSASTRLPVSVPMRASLVARHSRVAEVSAAVLGCHQLGPAPVKPAMVRFAVAIVARQRREIGIEPLVSQAHCVVQRMAAGDDAAAGLGAALPIVHVVLLECATRSEHAGPGEPD